MNPSSFTPTGLFILKGTEVVPAQSVEEWGRFFESTNRTVAQMRVETPDGTVRIVTSFVGIDLDILGPLPMVFETMVFGGKHDGYQYRTSTYVQAELAHVEVVNKVLSDL